MPVAALPLAALAVSAAGTATAYEAQSQNARRQTAYGNQVYEQTAKASGKNELNQFNQVGLRSIQETQSAEQQAQQAQIVAAENRGQLRASAGQQGVSGSSLDQLFGDFNRIEAMNEYTQGRNLNMVDQQLGQQDQSIYAENQSRISGAVPSPVAMPSAAASALQIAGAGINSYNTYKKNNSPAVT